MVISVAVIVIAMIVVVAPTGLWSYSPGEPEFEPVHEVDPQAFIDNEARAADYDIFFQTRQIIGCQIPHGGS